VGILFKTLYSWKLATLLPFLFFFALNQSYAQDRTLQWDENTDPDLAGYKFYYGLESRYPNNPAPYNGAGATEGDSPIDIGNVTQFTVQGLSDGVTYFFAVTAYDIDNLESGFSNEEMTLGITWPGGGFYVNDEPGSPNYSAPYTIRGRADKDSQVTLSDDDGNSWTVSADSDRNWSKDLDFKALYGNSDRTVEFTVESNGITAPPVIATYDVTDPTSQAASATDTGSFVAITWSASDTTSGVAFTELWCKPPGGTWGNTGLSQGGTAGTFYYIPTQGDGEYFFATRSVDRAGNWEAGPNGDGDTSTQYIAPSGGISGKEGGGGGCFITTAAPDLFSEH